MNPVRRRGLPPSVRRLLTDIAPKEEWEDEAHDAVAADGILLPARGGQEEFLSPAKPPQEQATGRRSAVCMLCQSKPPLYTCPRCNLQYCGLSCYQSPEHSVCSEGFYKESVLQELKDMGKTEADGRKKMQEILVGLRQKAQRTDGGMGSVLREAGVMPGDTEGGGDTEESVQAVELLSRLAELQQSGEEGATAEIEAILENLEQIGGEECGGDDDTESADLADRLSGLDIDKLSEEELWGLLDSKEKEGFVNLMKGGALGGLVPLWKPWWEEHEEGGRALIEVLEEDVKKLAGQTPDTSENAALNQTTKVRKTKRKDKKETSKDKDSSVDTGLPPISTKIPKLSSLCANPSPLICYGLVNALFCYTFTLCLFNGDTDSLIFEFCDMILALSEALNSGRVFNSIHEALDSGESLILGGGYLDKGDSHTPARALEAVAHVMTGRDRKDSSGYCLAGLSQIRSALSQARATLSKEGEEGTKRQKYFLASKKCEFFQAWVLENPHQTRTLAIELWNEHSRREALRTGMEKAKTVVDKSLKKTKLKGKMIEELS